MTVVDSDVWSEALRKKKGSDESWQVARLRELILADEVQMLGAIRQEALSGIRSPEKFGEIRGKLRAFPDGVLGEGIYEKAATFYNLCRGRGIQGSHIDFLICAFAVEKKMEILTKDRDFERYAPYIPIELVQEG